MNKENITCIIVDDELRARRVLRELIERYLPNLVVKDDCADIPCAVLSIQKHTPDIVFLDIDMPVHDGFKLLEFYEHPHFAIIFVTAHSEFAIRAFEVSAVDYLLKPVRIDHLERSIERYQSKQSIPASESIEALRANLSRPELSRLALPVSDGLLMLDVDKITYLEADGAYTRVHLAEGKSHLISKKLIYFEEKLKDNKAFIRIHRSTIIQLNYVSRFHKGSGIVELHTDIKVKASRELKKALERRLVELG